MHCMVAWMHIAWFMQHNYNWFVVFLGEDVSIVCLEGDRWHAWHSCIVAYCMVACNITTNGWFEVDYFSVF